MLKTIANLGIVEKANLWQEHWEEVEAGTKEKWSWVKL